MDPILGADSTLGGDQASIESAARRFRLQVGIGDQGAIRVVTRAWKAADAAIGERQDAYLAKIAQARAEGKPITEAWLYQVARLDQLRAYTAAQYTQVGIVLDRQVTAAQREGIPQAIDATQQFMRLSLGDVDIPTALDFANMDVDRTLTGLVGRLQTGSPLRDLTFGSLSIQGAESVAQALLRGAVRGDSIQDIAAAMRQERNLTLARAQTIARTEILRASRDASLGTMLSNQHLVRGWKWSSARDGNTCGICAVRHGELFPTGASFDTHPNCRCAPVPITKSWDDLGYPGIPATSATNFLQPINLRSLPGDELVRMFGKGKADLIQGGYLQRDDMIRLVDRARWGTQPRLLTLKEAQALASYRGWTPPAAPKPAPAPLPPAPAPRQVLTQDVPGLEGTLVGPSLQAEMDRLHTEHVDRNMRWNQAQRDYLDVAAQHPNDHMHPDVRAAVQRREDIQQGWRDWTNAQGTLLGERRDQLTAYLKANAHLIPPDQARRLRAELDGLETWAKIQKGRIPTDPNPALFFGKRNWDQLVDRAVGNPSLFRRLVSGNLPLMERLVPPKIGDALFPGSRQSIGSPKSLAKVRATWDEVFRLADALERRFGWNTAWTGRLGIGGTGSGAAGTFDWNGVLSLSTSVVGKYALQDRMHVVIHELFHSMSEGKGGRNAGQYVMSRGWEEGVVERATQVWEARILKDIGVVTTKAGYTTYDQYTKPLERMRVALGMSEDDYYLGLLEVPVTQRSAKAKEWAKERGVTLAPGDLSPLGM